MAIIAKFTRTLPAPTATISGGFVFLLSAGWFTQADTGAAGSPIDGGTNSIANGGGDMQIFSDTGTTTRLPIEVVTFVTGGSPQCQVWVRTPSYTAGGTQVAITSSTQSGGVLSVVPTADVVFTASGGSIGPFQYVAFYNSTPAGGLTVSYFDRGSPVTLLDTETFTVDVQATLFTAS